MDEGVETMDSVIADVLPLLSSSVNTLGKMGFCSVDMGSEGCRLVDCGVDMQSVGGMGRLRGRRSFGGRSVGRGGDGERG